MKKASLTDEKICVQGEIKALTEQQMIMTEDNRKHICNKIAHMMLTAESFEVKRYLAAVIDRIVVSNTNIELSLNIA